MISEDEEDEDDDPFLRLQVLPASACTTNSSDATGKFPFPTKSGWNYLLVSTMNGYIHLELMARSKRSICVCMNPHMSSTHQEGTHLPHNVWTMRLHPTSKTSSAWNEWKCNMLLLASTGRTLPKGQFVT
jgi:hypothetical protein